MNILLTTARAPERIFFCTNEKLFPLGLGYLSTILREAKHRIFFFDPYYDPSESYNLDFLISNNIDVVGIYACTICIKDVIVQVKNLRKWNWKGKVIVGGPHCSVADMADYKDYIDHVVNGEAEESIVDIVDGNRDEYLIKAKPIEDLDSLPRPAYDLIGNRDYRCHDKRVKSPVFNMNTSRGCPYNCAFCSSGPISGRKYRCQSAERIIDDILFLKSTYNVGSIYFRENNFCVSKERTIIFCEMLLKRNIHLDWRCEASVKDLPRDILKLMKKAGCKGLFVGFETGSERLLKLFKPSFSLEENIRVAKLCGELDIPMHASFLVGTPYETEDDVQKTLDFIETYIPNGQSCINVYIGLHGSKIYKELDESGEYGFKDKLGLIYTQDHDENVRRFHKITSPTHHLLIPKPDMDAKVAVIMSVYNGEKYLRDSLDSVLAQTFQDFVILIVDDGSTDSTREILEGYDDPRLHLFINVKNEKLPRNLNYLLKYIKTEYPDIPYVARQDADDISHPERFAKQVEVLDNNPDLALVGTNLTVIDENGEELKKNFLSLPEKPIDIKKILPFYNVIAHGSVMWRYSLTEKVGYYDPSIPVGEDYELWMRFASRYDISIIPEYLYKWRTWKTYTEHSESRERILINQARQKLICRLLGVEPPDNMAIQLIQLDFGSLQVDELNWQFIFARLNIIHEKLIRQITSKKIVIYGAGSIARYLYPNLFKKNEIIAFVDINEELHYKQFDDNATIYPPEYLRFLDFDILIITPLNQKKVIAGFLLKLLGKTKMEKVLFLNDVLKDHNW